MTERATSTRRKDEAERLARLEAAIKRDEEEAPPKKKKKAEKKNKAPAKQPAPSREEDLAKRAAGEKAEKEERAHNDELWKKQAEMTARLKATQRQQQASADAYLKSHTETMQHYGFPVDSSSPFEKRDFFSHLGLKMKVVDYFRDGAGSAEFVKWARNIGFNVQYDRGSTQIGYSCGVIAGSVSATIHKARRAGIDFQTVDVPNAVLEEDMRRHYRWLDEQYVLKRLQDEERRGSTVDHRTNTRFLADTEVQNLYVANTADADYYAKTADGAFENEFTDVSELPTGSSVRTTNLFMTKEVVVKSMVKMQQTGPGDDSKFKLLVSNTEASGRGMHWFTVAFEIAPQRHRSADYQSFGTLRASGSQGQDALDMTSSPDPPKRPAEQGSSAQGTVGQKSPKRIKRTLAPSSTDRGRAEEKIQLELAMEESLQQTTEPEQAEVGAAGL